MPYKNFMVIGAQRSGTSLLSRILNRHPDLAVPPESFYFNTFVPLAKYYGDLTQDKNLMLLIRDVLATPKLATWRPRPTEAQVWESISERTLGGVFVALMESWAVAKGKAVWGEKTPHHVLYWAEIAKAMPNIRVVHIVRDGRDVVLGLLRARFGPKSVYAGAERWRDWMRAIEGIQKATPESQFFQIQYEDLLSDPAPTLTRLCEFLGVEFSSRLLEVVESDIPYSSYAAEHENLNKPLLASKIAGWKKNMRAADVDVFEAVAGCVLKHHGYPVVGSGAKLSSAKRIYLKWVDHPPRKLLGLLRNGPGFAEESRLAILRAKRIIGYYLARR